MSHGPDQPSEPGESAAPAASSPARGEIARVATFLSHVEAEAAVTEEQLRTARASIIRLEKEIADLHEARTKTTVELGELRAAYDAEIKTRGEKLADFTEEFLRKELAAQLEDVRTQVATQYEGRVSQLEQALADEASAGEQGREREATLAAELARIKRAAEQKIEKLGEAHRREKAALADERTTEREQIGAQFTVQLEQVRNQIAHQHEERIAQLEATIAEQREALAFAKSEVAAAEERAREKLIEADARLEQLREDHRADAVARMDEHQTTRVQIADQYDAAVRRLESALKEKDLLVQRSNETVGLLQQENERLRALSSRDLKELQEAQTAELRKYKNEIASLEEERTKLRRELREIEKFVSDHDDLRRIKEFNQERLALEQQIREQEATIENLAYALAIFRDICNRSPAARSIIAGAGGDVDLESLFEILE